MGRKRIDNKRVRTNVMIDPNLKALAKEHNINLSKALDEALREKIKELEKNKNKIKKY